MKKIVLTLVVVLFAITAFAQQNERKSFIPNGYQGFFEESNSWHFDKNMSTTIQLSTTHGFYFGDHVYAGLGLGFEFNSDNFMMPIYANFRYMFINTHSVTPFVSLRLGSYMAENVGAYGDLAVGVRFSSKKDFAVSVLLAGTYYDKIEQYKWMNNDYQAIMVSPAGLSLRVGIEW